MRHDLRKPRGRNQSPSYALNCFFFWPHFAESTSDVEHVGLEKLRLLNSVGILHVNAGYEYLSRPEEFPTPSHKLLLRAARHGHGPHQDVEPRKLEKFTKHHDCGFDEMEAKTRNSIL